MAADGSAGHLTPRRVVPVVAGALAGVLLAVPAAPAAHLRVGGAVTGSALICQNTRTAVLAAEGQRLSVNVVRAERRSLPITVEQCAAGQWINPRRIAAGSRRGTTVRAELPALKVGDYRLQTRDSKPAYLRVGVGEIVDLPVSFKVRNTNTSKVTCPTDGAEYEIKGHLTAPRQLLGSNRRAVTLYLHGNTVGEFQWRLPVPGYDYTAELAKLGHASVVIDRLGYDSSGHPQGTQACIGGEADITHQVIDRLRRGEYLIDRGSAPRFTRIALAGHSGGAIPSQVEAYSYHDIDALIVIGWADGVPSPVLIKIGLQAARVCSTGGEAVEDDGSGPGGYAYQWQNPEEEVEDVFFDPDPAVVAAFVPRINRNPCGNAYSVPQTEAMDMANLGTVNVPVLLAFGAEDKIFPASTQDEHKARFTGSSDVTLLRTPKAGHDPINDRAAPVFRNGVADWLRQRGF